MNVQGTNANNNKKKKLTKCKNGSGMALKTDIIYHLVISQLVFHLPFCLRVFGKAGNAALLTMHQFQLPEPINSVAYTKIVQKMLHQFQNPHESTIISG